MVIKEFIKNLEESNFSLAVENGKLILKGDKKKLTRDEIQAIQTNESVISFIRENKNELIQYVSISSATNSGKKSKDISSLYSLTGLQQGMLFHSLYDETSGAYIDQFSGELTGLDPELFTRSWDYLLKTHTILRTAFYYDAFSIPVQCVYDDAKLPVEYLDYRHMDAGEQRSEIKKYEETNRRKGFNFKKPPLMRLGLIRLADDRYTMVWSFHHILFDGWSLPVLMEEFLTTYELLRSGKEVTLPPEDRFEDFIRYIERINKQNEESYWKNYISGVEQGTLLPFIPPVTDRNKGIGIYNTISLRIENAFAEKIQSYAQKNRITINTLMQGVWSSLLHHYTGNTDIVFGVIVSGRPDDLPAVERRVGLYINTLPLHSVINEKQSLVEWLQGLQQQQVSSRQYQHTPLQTIQSWAGIKGDFFDTILVFENYPVSKIVQSRTWSLGLDNLHTWEQTNYPLTLTIGSGEHIGVRFRYNSRLLSDEYAGHIRNHFEHVLSQIVNEEVDSPHNIQLLTSSEQNNLLTKFNRSQVDYPADKTIVDLIEEQVIKNPDKTALVFENEKLTYREFNERSNQLAHLLQAKGVKPETLVPLFIERSLEMLIGVMGILKAGGAYVPVDPDYPEERVKYMLEDTKATIVVSSHASKDKLQGFDKIDIISLDNNCTAIRQYPSVNVPGIVKPHHLAYVIYTSGSTGRPKGVMIEHAALMDHCYGVIESADLRRCASFAIFAPLVFDAGHSMFHSAFIMGASTHVLSNRVLTDGDQLAAYINNNDIDCIKIVPSLWLTYADTGNVILARKLMIFGGEGFAASILDRLTKVNYDGDVFNHYGPTEATIGKTIHKVDLNKQYYSIPIGKPFSNTQLYIVDPSHRPVPVGVAGELMIAGDGLARGYLNLPEMTAQKFIKDPFSKDADAKMYKTGDQARWLSDGNIEYLGRIDEQVKIRGFRIETGEIEGVIQQSDLVHQGVVVAKQDSVGNKRLIAYIVPKPSFTKESMVNFLRNKLPDYMIPVLWVPLESLPLTTNGKINKKALPDPDASDLLSDQFVAPRTDLESRLADIWKEILGVERVGVHDNFFDLGGHSLLVMRLISAIRKELKVELAISTFFELLTIEGLANYIKVNQNIVQKTKENYDTIKL
jgi:amino acid adenylation domain-containing protein